MADSNVDIQQSSAIEQFQGITGATQDVAKNILEACNWNLEMAINMHVDSIEPVARASTSSAAAATASTSETNGDPDHVRAPIPPVRQVLVEDDYGASYRSRRATSSVFDAFRDFQAEASWQEEMQSTSDANGEEGAGSRRNKRRTLQDMYRPPLDLLFRGSLEAAKDEGTKKNKWLLVNVQSVQEFSCQVLNRDVWSNSAVKDIVAEHFVFWQIYHDSSEGQRYCQFYNVHDFPHIAIVDPRTGEKMRHWNQLDAVVFCEHITEFISEHPSPDGSIVGPSTSGQASGSKSRRIDQSELYEQSEEDQLKAAIAASLLEAKSQAVLSDDETDEDIVCLDSDEDNDFEVENHSSQPTSQKASEKWEDFLGSDKDKMSQLILRFPDGSRHQKDFPSDSQLKALLLYVSSNGYDMNEYEVVTNFPRRNLNELPATDTLSAVGLFPRETVFVQQKSTQ